jgi:predicted Zn-dependent protease
MLIGQLINLKFGRDDELEADRYGVCFIDDSGYDPNEMINVMQILEAASSGNEPPEFFSTHPSPANRIQRIQDDIQNIGSCPQ